MPKLIEAPMRIDCVGTPPKTIEEFVGGANTQTPEVSVARMKSPEGWSEPGQTPSFREITVVLEGTLTVETRDGTIRVGAGQAVMCEPGEWIRYSTPDVGGAQYVAVCLPAFSPDTVNRDDE